MVVVDKYTVDIEADSQWFWKWIEESKQKLSDFDDNVKTKTSWLWLSFTKLWWIIAWIFAVDKLIDFWKKLFSLWSDLEETNSKFNTVFSWVEESSRETFNNIADNVWRARLEVLQYWASIWDILNPLWFLKEDTATLSSEITKLAIDVASFNNVQDEQVINAFKAALTWERESLKSLWIVISEADLKNKALNDWIIEQWEELSKTQKALITYQLLLDNTTDAQWDAIRTWQSFANQLKRLWWVITDTFADAWQQVAQDSASILWTIWDFIRTYWVAFIKSFLEIWKSIFNIIWTAFRWIWLIFNSFINLFPIAQKQQLWWADWLIFVLNRINNAIQIIIFAFKALWKFFWTTFAFMSLTATDFWSIFVDIFRLSVKAVWEAFWFLPKKLSVAISKWLNQAVQKLNDFLNKINEVFWTDYKINVKFQWTDSGDFSWTKQIFWEIQEKANNIWKTFKNVSTNLSEEIKKDSLNLLLEMDKSSTKVTSTIKTQEQLKRNEYDETFDNLGWLLEKYWQQLDWIWETAKSSTKKQKDWNKDLIDWNKELASTLEDIQKVAQKTYEKTDEQIAKSNETIWKLKEQYKDLWEKIKDTANKWIEEYKKLWNEIEKTANEWANDIDKLNEKIWDLNKKLAWIEAWWTEDLVSRQLDAQKELQNSKEKEKEIQKEINKLNKKWLKNYTNLSESSLEDIWWAEIWWTITWDEVLKWIELQKQLNELQSEQVDLQNEIDFVNKNTTEEERLNATIELRKSKSEKILENIEEKKAEVQAEIDWIIEQREARKVELEENLENLKILQEAKKVELEENLNNLLELKEAKKAEIDAEIAKREELTKRKIELDKFILETFKKNAAIERNELQRLITYYNKLAAAKRRAWVTTATTTKTLNFWQVATPNEKSVNIYWDQTFNTETDIDEFAEKISWKTD